MNQPDQDGDQDGSSRNHGAGRPVRRRNRMINSCLECRKRKLRCSRASPACGNCVNNGRECLYIGSRLDQACQIRLAEHKEKQGTLERQLERDIARTTTRATVQQRIFAQEMDDEYDENGDLEATPLVALDMTYEDDADGENDMIDLGIQIGRMRITERIGGLSRPRLSEEIHTGLGALSAFPGLSLGGSPPPMGGGMGGPPGLASGLDGASDSGASDGSLPDFLRPGSQYIVPTSGFFFGQVSGSPSLITFLPTRASADWMMRAYYTSVHPIAPCTHRPSLEKAYVTFWEDINAGYEPRPSCQAIVFSAMFSGTISMEDEEVVQELGGMSKAHWMSTLKLGTETALSKANFLRSTRIETMQAFIMYMLPLCRAEVSRAHSVLVGAAIRMAECMGLHRDGEKYGLTPLETHVRRLIWHQLCFLDIRTCEAQGPKPVIRAEDYDTELPLNCNEDDLTSAVRPPESCNAWTTNTLALIRFQVNEMMRSIWIDRRKLERRKTSLTSVITKIENFRRHMSETYDHLFAGGQPLQRYARVVMHLLTYRLHVMVLHPYHANATNPMPQRLNSLLIQSGIVTVECAIQLETSPLFQSWSWYLGAYFQYQVALLLATEVYYRPSSKEARRIWDCLNYVFNLDRHLPSEAKGMQLLSEIAEKTATYMRARRIRGPSQVVQAMPNLNPVFSLPKLQTQGSSGPIDPLSGLTQAAQAAQDSVAAAAAAAAAAGAGRGAPGIPLQQQQQQQQQGLQQGLQQQQQGNGGGVGLQTASSTPRPQLAMPVPTMVFAGVSNGEALWSLPPNKPPQHHLLHHTASPPSDDACSVHQLGSMAGGTGTAGGAATPGAPNYMDVDWDTLSTLFPNDPQTGGLNIHEYNNPAFVPSSPGPGSAMWNNGWPTTTMA